MLYRTLPFQRRAGANNLSMLRDRCFKLVKEESYIYLKNTTGLALMSIEAFPWC